MYAVSSPDPSGESHSNSAGNCISVLTAGPHWWNGPRAHDEEVSPACAISPGNPGSNPNASSIHADAGAASATPRPRIPRWNPIPYTALRIVVSAPVRLVFGSL